MFRVVVAGSRTFNDYEFLKEKLDYLLQNKTKDDIVIISGNAVGADQLGERYALNNGIKLERYLPDWKTYGKRAGIYRNILMIDKADALVTFWDGVSNGTAHSIGYAKKKGILVRVYKFETKGRGKKR